MMFALVWKLLRDARRGMAVVALLLFLFSLLWVKIAHKVSTENAPLSGAIAKMLRTFMQVDETTYRQLMTRGQGRLMQSMMGGAEIRFGNPNDFLAVELLHPVVVILATMAAVGRTSGAIAGEIEKGTMELLLSQPIPRHRLLLAHWIVDLIFIPLLCLSLWSGTQLGLTLVGPFEVDYSLLDRIKTPFPLPRGESVLEVDASAQGSALVATGAYIFALSGISIAISAFGRSGRGAMGIAGTVAVGMYLVNVVGQMWEPVAKFRPATLFFYYRPQAIWLKGDWRVDLGESIPELGSLSLDGVVTLLVVGICAYGVATFRFLRRDLPAPL